MTKLPIHTLLDKDKKPFIPFVTAKCIPLDGTGDTVYDRLEALNNKEVVQPSVATEVTAVYNYQTLPVSDVTPTESNQLVNKQYVDDSITSIDVGDVEGGGMPIICKDDISYSNPFVISTTEPGIYRVGGNDVYIRVLEGGSRNSIRIIDGLIYVLKKYEDAEIDEVFCFYTSDTGRVKSFIKKDNSFAELNGGNGEILRTSYNNSISGQYTYTKLPKSSVTPTEDEQFTNKKYVDDAIANIDVGGESSVFYISDNSHDNPIVLSQCKAGIYVFPNYEFYLKLTETSNTSTQKTLDCSFYVTKSYEDAEIDDICAIIITNNGMKDAFIRTETSYKLSTSSPSDGSVLRTGSTSTILAVHKYNKLPESSKVPTTDNQFVNKAYVDNAVANAAPAVDITTFLNYKGHVASVEDLPSTGQASGTATAEVAIATYDFTENTATTQAQTGYDYFISVGNTRVPYRGVISTNFPEIIEWLNIGKYSDTYFVATAYVNASEEKPAYLSGYYESRTGIAVTLTSTGITDARNDGILTEPAIVYFGHLYEATRANSYIKGNLPSPLKYKPLNSNTWYYRHQYANLGTYNYTLTGYTSLKLDFADGYTYTDGMQMLAFDPETHKANWVLNESMATPNEVYTVGDDHQVYHCDNTPKWNRWNNTYSKSEIDEMLGNAEAVLTEVLEGTTV